MCHYTETRCTCNYIIAEQVLACKDGPHDKYSEEATLTPTAGICTGCAKRWYGQRKSTGDDDADAEGEEEDQDVKS